MYKVVIEFVSIHIKFKNIIIKFLMGILWSIRNKCYDNICLFSLGNIGELLCILPYQEYLLKRQLENNGAFLDASVSLIGTIGD